MICGRFVLIVRIIDYNFFSSFYNLEVDTAREENNSGVGV